MSRLIVHRRILDAYLEVVYNLPGHGIGCKCADCIEWKTKIRGAKDVSEKIIAKD